MKQPMRGADVGIVWCLLFSVPIWLTLIVVYGYFFGLPAWAAVTVVHLIELVAGVFLGVVGLVLCADFGRWWYHTRQPGNYRVAALVLLALYIGALAIIRYV